MAFVHVAPLTFQAIIKILTLYILPKQIRKHNQLQRVKAVSMWAISVENGC